MSNLEKLTPDKSLPLGYLSVSSLTMYLRCPKQYEFRYIHGLKSPPSVALVEGSSHHIWLAHNNDEKIKTGEDSNADDMVDLFSEVFFEKSQEIKQWEGSKVDDVIDRGGGLVSAFMDTAAEKIVPIKAEEKFEVEIGGVPVIGYIDVITRREVLDYKVVARAKSENDVRNSLQLATYSIATKKPKVGFVCLTKTKTPAVKFIETALSPDLKTSAGLIYKGARDAIKSGSFPMTDPSNWGCSSRFCGYWKLCRGKNTKRTT